MWPPSGDQAIVVRTREGIGTLSVIWPVASAITSACEALSNSTVPGSTKTVSPRACTSTKPMGPTRRGVPPSRGST